MSSTILESVTVLADRARMAGPAKRPAASHAAVVTMAAGGSRVPASRGCAPTYGLGSVVADSNFISGSPSWSPPV